MKKYLQKLMITSSTTKLIIFVLLLLVVVLFASSSLYIRYRNKATVATPQPAQQIKGGETTQKPPSLATDNSTQVNKTTEVLSKTPSPTRVEKTAATACTEQVLPFKAIEQSASWLGLGESITIQGRSGYTKICSNGTTTTQPLNQITYKGLQPLSKLLSLLGINAEGVKSTKTQACVESVRNLLSDPFSYEQCYKLF